MRILAVALLAGLALACRDRDVTFDSAELAVFAPLPPVIASDANPITPAKVELGWRLYYETRLSADGSQSCNSCHLLDAYGVDGRPVSTGVTGEQGARNAPTVYNAAGHIAQFWDGRARDVEEQAKGPILNPIEMAIPSPAEAMARLAAIPGYREAFAAAFPDERRPMTYDNLGKAIGAFERQLLTPGRWDRFLEGDARALTNEEKRGLEEFLGAGCQACHNGAYMGGQMFQRVGVARPWPDSTDPGRYAVTHQGADSLVFKVPGLRNIVQTAPYFNDGQTPALDAGVDMMARHQLGRELTPKQVASILIFLGALTGDVPGEYVTPPPAFPSAAGGT